MMTGTEGIPAKRFFCEVCDEGFSCEGSLDKHCQHVHSETDGNHLQNNACDVCSKVLKSKVSLLAHRKLHTGEGVVECEICGKKCQTKCTLKQHLLTHNGERPHACDTCGMRFKQKVHLVNHQRRHTAERPFLCANCGKGFRQRYDLVRHARMHTGDRPFKCPSCPLTFRIKSILNNHMRTHSGEKPYPCPECGTAFRVRSTLNRHLLVHSKTRAFVCNQCDRPFKRKEHLQQHMKSHNKLDPKVPSKAPTEETISLAVVHYFPNDDKGLASQSFQQPNAVVLTTPASSSSSVSFPTHETLETYPNLTRILSRPLSDVDPPTDAVFAPYPPHDPSHATFQMPNTSFPANYSSVTRFADVASLSQPCVTSSHLPVFNSAASNEILPPPISIPFQESHAPFQEVPPSFPETPASTLRPYDPPFSGNESSILQTDVTVLKPVLLDNLNNVVSQEIPAANHSQDIASNVLTPTTSEQPPLTAEAMNHSVMPEIYLKVVSSSSSAISEMSPLTGMQLDIAAASVGNISGEVSSAVCQEQTVISTDELEAAEASVPSCATCQRSFKTQQQLEKHRQRYHSAESPSDVKVCEDCGKCFQSDANLRSHKNSVHRQGHSVICPTCGKTLKGKTSLQAHMAIHTDTRTFVCSLCAKSFRQKVHLQRHMMQHTGEKPCLCQYCPKRFKQLADLARHMRTHTGEKPFVCPHCKKAFAVEHCLKSHLRIHSGEKPYTCSLCNASFRVKITLDRHLTTHSDQRPFKCPGCNQAFKRKDHLAQHWRTVNFNCSCAMARKKDLEPAVNDEQLNA